ncbi:MAG: sensor histidine kinase [Actinomycetota bacterium]|nr:sensor histidine kinase [Actinomycetota bacterium]
MRRGTLLTQVLAVNLLLIAAAVLAAAIASNPDSTFRDRETIGVVLGFALALTVAVNVFLLSQRFEPLEHLVEQMENADLSRPTAADAPPIEGPEEIQRLSRSFHEMLERLEAERRAGAHAALEAQERERARVALDLHDEVNQALTGLLLRVEAMRRTAPEEIRVELAETGAVAARAMDELLTLARQLRPTTLDDLGLSAALAGLVEETGRRSGIVTAFESEGDVKELSPDVQLVAYRIAQEATSNAVQHSGAGHVRVRLLESDGDMELRVSDDGSGFDPSEHGAGLGIAGMRERALLINGVLDIESVPGAGTRVRLRARLPIRDK